MTVMGKLLCALEKRRLAPAIPSRPQGITVPGQCLHSFAVLSHGLIVC